MDWRRKSGLLKGALASKSMGRMVPPTLDFASGNRSYGDDDYHRSGTIRIYDTGESCPDWPQCFGTWGFDVSEEDQGKWYDETEEG